MATQIPTNTSALIYLPASKNITVNGKSIEDSTGLKYLKQEAGYTIFEAGSGNYVSEAALQ